MADEDPSATSPAADPSAPKKETVRITLPPKPEDTPMVKRETVRINAPGVAPKKETTTIGAATPLPGKFASVPPAPSATRPLVPPPRPPTTPGLPNAGARPGMPPVAPRPAAAPLRAPTPAPAPKASSSVEATPVTIKAAPKKETARIQINPTQKLPPQATVRLAQSTQSLAAGPAPAIRTAAPAAATVETAGTDTVVTILSWAAVAVSLAAAAISYMAFSA